MPICIFTTPGYLSFTQQTLERRIFSLYLMTLLLEYVEWRNHAFTVVAKSKLHNATLYRKTDPYSYRALLQNEADITLPTLFRERFYDGRVVVSSALFFGQMSFAFNIKSLTYKTSFDWWNSFDVASWAAFGLLYVIILQVREHIRGYGFQILLAFLLFQFQTYFGLQVPLSHIQSPVVPAKTFSDLTKAASLGRARWVGFGNAKIQLDVMHSSDPKYRNMREAMEIGQQLVPYRGYVIS